jgi:hypothetical protein
MPDARCSTAAFRFILTSFARFIAEHLRVVLNPIACDFADRGLPLRHGANPPADRS